MPRRYYGDDSVLLPPTPLAPVDQPGLVSRLAGNPFVFAMGVGLANGLLAKMRGKSITPKAAIYMALILGAGEAALASEEPAEERTNTVSSIGWMSILGVFVGIAAFTNWTGAPSSSSSSGGGILPSGVPVASNVDLSPDMEPA